jgi:hypothetical protein
LDVLAVASLAIPGVGEVAAPVFGAAATYASQVSTVATCTQWVAFDEDRGVDCAIGVATLGAGMGAAKLASKMDANWDREFTKAWFSNGIDWTGWAVSSPSAPGYGPDSRFGYWCNPQTRNEVPLIP